MPSVFDGMARALSGAFGDMVTIRPRIGQPCEVRAVIRSEAIEELDDLGGPAVGTSEWVILLEPTDAASVKLGDVVEHQIDGACHKFSILRPLEPSAPTADGLRTFVLKRV